MAAVEKIPNTVKLLPFLKRRLPTSRPRASYPSVEYQCLHLAKSKTWPPSLSLSCSSCTAAIVISHQMARQPNLNLCLSPLQELYAGNCHWIQTNPRKVRPYNDGNRNTHLALKNAIKLTILNSLKCSSQHSRTLLKCLLIYLILHYLFRKTPGPGRRYSKLIRLKTFANVFLLPQC